MPSGYIYAFAYTNEIHDVKIGKTTKLPEERLRKANNELRNLGNKSTWVSVKTLKEIASVPVNDIDFYEKKIHTYLQDTRQKRRNRPKHDTEWFSISHDRAKEIFRDYFK